MKRILFVLFAFSIVFVSCNKEPAVEPNAQFSTKLIDNTAYAGETFYIYLDDCRGDFFALYKGLTKNTTYNPDTVRQGEDVDINTDSVAVTYNSGGEYKLTLVASSSGNWAEEYLTDVYTMNINVEDARAQLLSMDVGNREGIITEENEVLFYAHKLEDIDNERVIFITASADAEVYVGGVLQENGRERHDFSAVNPGDDEGRPVIYTIKAPTGDEETYTVKFILRDPSSDKVVFDLSSSNLDAEFTINEEDKEIMVSYYTGASLSGALLANVSPGAIAEVGGAEIQERERPVDLEEDTELLVTAEDLSQLAYTFVLYEKEWISEFNFVSYTDADDVVQNISPVLSGDVDFDSRTIGITVPKTLPLDAVVADFEGITDFTVKIGDVTLTDGVTAFDYTFDEPAEGEDPPTSKDFTMTVYDGDTPVDTYTLTVSY